MGISTAPQLRDTYLLMKRFELPIEGGTRDAIAVKSYVANQLNSAYTLMMTSMVMNLWCILFAVAFYYMLERKRHHRISTSLWNKRNSLTDSLLEVLQPSDKSHWRQWWMYAVLFIVLFCWIAQNVLSIIVPPYIIIGNGAPVNPAAVIAPRLPDTSAERARLSSAEAPMALRAVGSAQVASINTQQKVHVGATTLGTTSTGDTIAKIDYRYTVSGADMGLQKYPTLLLEVTGACTTEYGWLLNSTNANGYTNDTYARFGDPEIGTTSLNLFDGPAPVAFFYNGPKPEGPPGNMTWAAFVSSVDRLSYTSGSDPMYATGNVAGLGGTEHAVRSRRPVLSCWQMDTWKYEGHSSTILGLNSTALPGLDLSPGLQLILSRYLGTPRIVSIGRLLGLSALLSSTTSIGNIFDAQTSNAFTDLRRLVLAAYIATTNTLTDLTLFSEDAPGRENGAANLAIDENGNIKPGVADFVVWSPDITTLSVKAIIIIPVLSLVLWLLALSLLRWTPLSRVNDLDATVLHKALDEHGAQPTGRGTWTIEKPSRDVEDRGPSPTESTSAVKQVVTNVKETPKEEL
ncbi:hypothetical protein QBC34DRAFT_338740 [Podospora aff. communis PSN243]|uniref:Glycoside Hydrolase Family 16 n=1 Tax=Podospora aff. communis PSN243 TaxID=3040156 RepID=A0AAV9FXK7_9PEZI|nr:hypothetical protein QBC34DRAFT_338740 [Podospora aff. communis PSN243]